MNYADYVEMTAGNMLTEDYGFAYAKAVLWCHPQSLPVGVLSMGDSGFPVVRIPVEARNEYGNTVQVVTFARGLFSGRKGVTDIILPATINRIPGGAFEGCSDLRRITISRSIHRIRAGTFSGCTGLEDIYYEGTPDEWNKINITWQEHEIEFGGLIAGTPVHSIKAERDIFIPGNEALFSANIHYRCDLSLLYKPSRNAFIYVEKT